MNPENRFSRFSLVAFAGLAGFVVGALLLWLDSSLTGMLPLSFGDAWAHLPMLMGGDFIFLIVWFAFWVAIGILVGIWVTHHKVHALSPALLSERMKLHREKSFTLIELLIVIAIIAVLATVVILVLNPAQLLMAARDSNRVSDIHTLNQALILYSEDVGTGMGASSVVYVSIPDPTATSTLGDQCQGLGLSTSSLPSGWTYHCAASGTYKNVNGTGWIPVDLEKISGGSPLASLPVDPTNTTSSGLYYTYVVNGDPWELTANMESSKYQMGGSHDVESKDGGQYPDLYEVGTDLSLMPVDYNPSLVGYWKLDEGSGTVAYDSSGHGNDGTWYGTQAGTSGYYSQGHGQTWAGYFDGSTNYVNVGFPVILSFPSNIFSVAFWINANASTSAALGKGGPPWEYGIFAGGNSSLAFYAWTSGGGSNVYNALNATYDIRTWDFFVWTADGNYSRVYKNGLLVATARYNSGSMSSTVAPFQIGYSHSSYANGLIDDVRIYNRALSASEIQAIYNEEK